MSSTTIINTAIQISNPKRRKEKKNHLFGERERREMGVTRDYIASSFKFFILVISTPASQFWAISILRTVRRSHVKMVKG